MAMVSVTTSGASTGTSATSNPALRTERRSSPVEPAVGARSSTTWTGTALETTTMHARAPRPEPRWMP